MADRRLAIQRAVSSGIVTRQAALGTAATILRLSRAGLEKTDFEWLAVISDGETDLDPF